MRKIILTTFSICFLNLNFAIAENISLLLDKDFETNKKFIEIMQNLDAKEAKVKCDNKSNLNSCLDLFGFYMIKSRLDQINNNDKEQEINFINMKKYLKKSYEISKNMCDNGDNESCQSLTKILDFDILDFDKSELVKIFENNKNLCETKNDLYACYKIAEEYYKGKIVSKNENRAIEIFEKYCNENEKKSCTFLAQIYGDNNLTKKADFYIQKSCDLNSTYYCDRLIAKFLKEKNYNQAFIYAMKNYNLGEVSASYILASLYLNGYGVEKDIEVAKKYFNEGCDSGLNQSCISLGDIYHKNKEYAKSFEIVNKSCKNNNPASCFMTGYYYETGKGAEQNTQEAQKFFKISCNSGFETACKFLR